MKFQYEHKLKYSPGSLPGVPSTPPIYPDNIPENKVVAVCGECGRSIYRLDMYSCKRENCPIQRKIII